MKVQHDRTVPYRTHHLMLGYRSQDTAGKTESSKPINNNNNNAQLTAALRPNTHIYCIAIGNIPTPFYTFKMAYNDAVATITSSPK